MAIKLKVVNSSDIHIFKDAIGLHILFEVQIDQPKKERFDLSRSEVHLLELITTDGASGGIELEYRDADGKTLPSEFADVLKATTTIAELITLMLVNSYQQAGISSLIKKSTGLTVVELLTKYIKH